MAVTCARYGTPARSGPDRPFSRDLPQKIGLGSRSEVEDDAGDGLEVVFILAPLSRDGSA
jgi:hypothetical protein